jgi:hypothetical protein
VPLLEEAQIVMRKLTGYMLGFIGFAMGFMAVISIPALVIFTRTSSWWMFLCPVLGFGQMIPLGMSHNLLKEEASR